MAVVGAGNDDLKITTKQLLDKLRSGVGTLKDIVSTSNFSHTDRNDTQISEKSLRINQQIPSVDGNPRGQFNDSLKSVELSSFTLDRSKQVGVPTSTPKSYRDALSSGGNVRRKERRKNAKGKAVKSILVTPVRSDKKKSTRKLHHVTFNSKEETLNIAASSEDVEKSMLGYDWIAGLLDNNTSGMENSDTYLNNIKEFRRLNRKECVAPDSPFLSIEDTGNEPMSSNKENNHQANDYVCKGALYIVNKRMCPVPIHGPDSYCPICKTKKETETEYDESYVRVSVPRSALQSPYKIRPHRRKSFDPSDSVALSEHCLAGWQCKWSSKGPASSTVDIMSAMRDNSQLPVGQRLAHMEETRQRTKDLLNSTAAVEFDMLRKLSG